MKTVLQTKFGEPDGNCHAACVASILEIELDRVPNFYADTPARWDEVFSQWLVENFDLQTIDLDVDAMNRRGWKPNGYHFINGPSRRGDFWHTVIGLDGVMVHDPHPDSNGLERLGTYTLFVSPMRK